MDVPYGGPVLAVAHGNFPLPYFDDLLLAVGFGGVAIANVPMGAAGSSVPAGVADPVNMDDAASSTDFNDAAAVLVAPDSEGAGIQAVEEAVYGVALCPVGEGLVYTVYLQCDNGHFLCQTCVQKVDVCPVCRGYRPYWRNRSMEDVIGRRQFPCRHRRLG